MKAILLTAIIGFSSAATAEVYRMDTGTSTVKWSAGKKIGTTHNGEVKIKSGTVETDKNGALVNATAVVDMKSISNDDLKDNPEYQKKLVGHLSSDDFFKVDKFPEASFQSTSITPKAGSKNEYLVKGNLTIIGKTQPVEFPVKVTTEKQVMKGTGTIKIERLKWGLQYGSGSIFKELTADKIINDTFDLNLNLVVVK